MRATWGTILFLAVVSSGLAQVRPGIAPSHPYTTPSGYPNILFPGTGLPGSFPNILSPGTGIPPGARPPGVITDITFGNRLSNTVAGRPFYSPNRPPQVLYPNRGRVVSVPYAYPVLVGGVDPYYGAPPLDNNGVPAGYAPSPTVIINQNYLPSAPLQPVYRDYSDAPLPEPASPANPAPPIFPGNGSDGPRDLSAPPPAAPSTIITDGQPTMYLVAYRDNTIYTAIAYWVEGDTLNYVTSKGTVNRVSLDLIDRSLTERLNRERNVEFSFSKGR